MSFVLKMNQKIFFNRLKYKTIIRFQIKNTLLNDKKKDKIQHLNFYNVYFDKILFPIMAH